MPAYLVDGKIVLIASAFLEWIVDAKQDTTRDKRIATAVEWLSEGKRRNWKYERPE